MIGLFDSVQAEVNYSRRLNLSHRTGVYSITNLVNGKCYIGSARSLFQQRWTKHRVELRENRHHSPHLQAAWNLYGESAFEFGVIEDTAKQNALGREQFWILFFRPEYNVCYVCSNGAFGRRKTPQEIEKHRAKMIGKRHTDESKAKMRAVAIGRIIGEGQRQALSKRMTGKPSIFKGRTHTEESIERIRASKIGKTWDSNQRGEHYMNGRKLSAEVRDRMSAAAKSGWEKRRAKA